MRQLLPDLVADVDPYAAYRATEPGGDLVRMNMIASADGSVVDAEGRSGSLGRDGDRAVFRALRALADAIVVGAGTVRKEGYGPHRMPAALAAARAADGRAAPAAVVVVSASLDLDYDAPLFTEAVTPTIVATTGASDHRRRRRAEAAGEVLIAGEDALDPRALVVGLRARAHRHLLLEGGPGLNRTFLDAGLVDELCLTLAPSLVGGDGPRLGGGSAERHDLELTSLLEHEGEVFARYRVDKR